MKNKIQQEELKKTPWGEETMPIPQRLFGTDGIRGVVGEPPITADIILRLGHTVGRAIRAHSTVERPAILIGKDTRLSGYLLESALEAGFVSAGVDVWLAGPIPTPAVAYLTRTLRLQAGVVISASHNPYADNGVKFFSESGSKLSDALEAEIERGMHKPPDYVAVRQLGRAYRLDDAAGRYIEFCKGTFPTDLRGLRLVVDSAHGAAYQLARNVFYELGAVVIPLGHQPDGLNINHNVGATHPEAMARAVVEHKADAGIALDGDGDRLIMCDREGRVLNGDMLLWILAMDRHRRGVLPGVVGTVMTNSVLEQALAHEKIPFVRTKVGDRYVLEELQKRQWTLGGESSGHLLCLEHHSTGDGIISALQVLLALQRRNTSITEECRGLSLYPQVLINVPVGKNFVWQDHPLLVALCQEIEKKLHGCGRVLLRVSGTEACLRVMVEGEDGELSATYAQQIAHLATTLVK